MSTSNQQPPAQTKAVQLSPQQMCLQWITSMQAEFEKVLARTIPIERFTRIVFTAVQTNPDLALCSKASMLSALMRSAVVGLEPDGTHAALVPYKGEVTFMPMYRGLIKKAREAGDVADIVSGVVHENDVFTQELGTKPDLKHVPAGFGKRGAIIAFYAVAFFKDGRRSLFEVMDKAEVDSIRNRSRAKNGPWATDYVEMGRKTPVRRLCKYLKLDDEMQRLITEDERFDTAADAEVVDDGKVARPKTPGDLLKSLTEDAPQSAQDAPVVNVAPKSDPKPSAQPAQPQPVQSVPFDNPFEDDAPAQQPNAPKPALSQSFPADPAHWYDPTKGGIDPNDPSELELVLGQIPAGAFTDWCNEKPWKGMLKDYTPWEAILGTETGKRMASLNGAVDFVKGRKPENIPVTALKADYCRALALKRFALMREAGLDPTVAH